MKSTFHFIIYILLCSYNSIAQPYHDLVHLQGQYSGFSGDKKIDSSYAVLSYFSLDLSVPLKLGNDRLAFSPSWSQIKVSGDSFSDLNLRSVALPIAYVRQWKNAKYKTSFLVVGRTNSDHALTNTEQTWQLGGALLQTIKIKENLKYKFGIYYNAEFFGSFFLPLAGIDWHINDRLNVFGVLPGSMNLEYKLSKRIHAGMSFRSFANSYRLKEWNFLRIYDNHLKAVVDFYVFKNHVLILEGGHSIFRKYRFGLREEAKTSYKDLNLPDSYLIKIAYAFRFRLDGKFNPR